MAQVTIPNYGLLNGLADGANSFLNAYQTAKNVKHQQQMQELLTGTTKDPNGNLVYTPEKQQQMATMGLIAKQQGEENTPGSNIANAASQFYKSQGYNVPDGMSYSEQKSLVEPLASAKEKGLFNPLAQVKEQQLDFSKHKTAVDSVVNDKPTQGLLNGVQSMQNALTEFKNNPSPQSFHTMQNVIRMNAGSGNRSGVNERADQYATDLGIKKDTVMQILTGNMSDVTASSPEMVKAIQKVYDGELLLKKQQAGQQIDKKASAFSSIYKNPKMADYKQDFDNAVQAQKQQFGLLDNEQPQAPQMTNEQKLQRIKELEAKRAGGG